MLAGHLDFHAERDTRSYMMLSSTLEFAWRGVLEDHSGLTVETLLKHMCWRVVHPGTRNTKCMFLVAVGPMWRGSQHRGAIYWRCTLRLLTRRHRRT